ncbi:M12 family metallo-peptidase [Hymenobacter sp. ASUV-10]|uniref:M12 family metallo-peptidase n=1 Tax=Hymenobacter aranciens TaxID=3063996 RepID=A0ABT9B8W9_9BACT|nr:M12 family metallo-peptidase [Hymenobacter sp. ASUV-10]MDO7874710.1 M12 family metallo-peptidase [Hymenobacter sp. ASUV-10]
MIRSFTSLAVRRRSFLAAAPRSFYYPLAAALLALGSPAVAQQRAAPVLFQDDAAARAAAQTSPLAALVRQARPFSLDPDVVLAALAAAPREGTADGTPVVLALPLPDGRTARFALRQTAVMAPALAARYPAIRTYSGAGLDDATASLRLSLEPGGLHAQVLSATAGPVYLDPVSLTDNAHYLSYEVSARLPPGPLPGCAAPASTLPAALPARRPASGSALATAGRSAGAALRVFKLAVATTDEYTAARGGTRASALAAVVTTVNRINGLYERELSVRLQLVNNNELIVAANSSTRPDPYSNNNDAGTALSENATHLNAVIGSANYDIGHLFGTYGGGYALIGILNNYASYKAYAQTGLSDPVGDAFDIQLVAHELGHQLGAYHSFNSTGSGSCSATNWDYNAACEPGSGSTLMAYPGLCGNDNLQGGRDAYFHNVSYEQIRQEIDFATIGTNGLPTGNTVPTVSVPASDKTLPIGTPFKLTAAATDANGDALTYCWDQLDLGPAAGLTAPQVADELVPLFRSWAPSSSPTRYFPRLSTLLANGTNLAERLPTVDRTLVFRCLVRDLHAGPQGVVGGSANSESVRLNVSSAAGPFVVTAPNSPISWTAGSTQTVSWNVAGTTANGVDCATVNIRLSTDGGLTYPILLLAGTPNDGSQAVTVPNVLTTTARLMVEAADNYFFDLSDYDFTITPAVVLPSLGSLSPASGPVGTRFTLQGSNLAGVTAVTVGSVRVPFTIVSASSLSLQVPDSIAGPAAVAATSSAGSSNVLPFSITPVISSLSPTTGVTANSVQIGTTVVITGSGLLGATEVRFNGLVVNNSTVNAAGTAITVTVPSGATSGFVTVLTPGGRATSPQPFTITERPCMLPSSVSFSIITATTARLVFAANPSAPRFYLATLSPGNRIDTLWTTTSFTYNNLIPNTIYTFTLRSQCGYSQSSPTLTRRFATPAAGSNNECAGATPLVPGAPGESCIPTGSSLGTATQSRPPAECSGSLATTARDVWFRFDAAGPVHTIVANSSGDGVLEVFAGPCGSLTSLQCADAVATGGESLTLTTLTPGTRYWVRYYHKDFGLSFFSACVTTPAPVSATCPAPANLVVSNVTANSASVGFSSSGPGNQYVVTTSPPSTTQTVSAGPVMLSNLRDATAYVVSVASACPDTTASAPVLATFTTDYPDLVIDGSFSDITARTYRNVTITGTGYGQLGGNTPAGRNVVVVGTFRIERGGYLDDNCRLITGPGNFVLEPGATMNICGTQGISLSGATGTVQVTGTRSFGRNGNYEYTTWGAAPAITGSGLPDTINTLLVGGDRAQHFNLSNTLVVRRYVQLTSASLYLGNSNLTLLSDIHGTASLYNEPGVRVVNDGSGRATVQRYIHPSTTYRGPGYRHYSSPLRAASVAQLAVPGQFAPVVNAAYNPLPAPALPANQFPTVFRYRESRLTPAFSDFEAGWESPASLNDRLVPAQGYTVNIPPSARVALTGELTCDEVNTGPLSRGSGPNAGWHLLGNPFPAPLFLAEYFNDSLPAGLARAVYVFEPDSHYGGFYRSYVNGVGTDGQPYLTLSVMQGFFMRVTQDLPGGYTFRHYLRGTNPDSAGFHRPVSGSLRAPRPLLRLTLAGTAAQGADHTVVYLESGATASGTDARYDAAKLTNPGAAPQLATHMPGAGNEPLAINGLPDLTARADIRVPLTLRLPAAGPYQLRVTELSNFDPSVPVWLLDHARGTRVNLRQQLGYNFTASQAGALDGRFELLLGRSSTALATTSAAANAFSVWPNPAAVGRSLQLALDAPAPAATATLTTLLGQPVARMSFGGSTAELATAGLAAGTYLLVVKAAGQPASTRRVVLE